MPCDGSRINPPLDKKQDLSAFLEYASFRNRFLLVHLSQASAANTGLGGQKLRVAEGPHHPSLHLKKIGRYWSVRIGLHYRAIATEADGDLRWHWIGSHADYDAKI
jgi:hypothetical protein